jgi:trimethylamine---corrinoid protein Co-methyltransferase
VTEKGRDLKEERVEISKSLLGNNTVDMLLQVHQDAIWTLENLGVGCKQPEMQDVFRRFEPDGLSVVYEDRVYVTAGLVEKCLETVPGVSDFFVPMNSFFIGGTAPYVYDDKAGKGGVFPTPEHAARIAQIAEENRMVAGMGRGIKLKDEVQQMNIMVENCTKPLYVAVKREYHDRFLSDASSPGG